MLGVWNRQCYLHVTGRRVRHRPYHISHWCLRPWYKGNRLCNANSLPDYGVLLIKVVGWGEQVSGCWILNCSLGRNREWEGGLGPGLPATVTSKPPRQTVAVEEREARWDKHCLLWLPFYPIQAFSQGKSLVCSSPGAAACVNDEWVSPESRVLALSSWHRVFKPWDSMENGVCTASTEMKCWRYPL